MKMISTLILSLMLLGFHYSAYAQWVDKGEYKQIETGYKSTYSGYLSKDGLSYYFTDNTAVFKINIESGTIDTLVNSGEVTGIEKFVLSDDENDLFFSQAQYLYKYNIISKSIEVTTTIKEKNIDLIKPYVLKYINNRVACFCGGSIDYDGYNESSSYGFLYFMTSDSLKVLKKIDVQALGQVKFSMDNIYCSMLNSPARTGKYESIFDYYISLVDLEKEAIESIYFRRNHFLNGDHIAYFCEPYFYPNCLNYLPKMNQMIMTNNRHKIYHYDLKKKKILDSAFVGNFDNCEPDISERVVLLSSYGSELYLFSLELNKFVDTIHFPSMDTYRVQKLANDFEYLIFDRNGKATKISFDICKTLDAEIVIDKTYETIDKPIKFSSKFLGYPNSWHWKFSDGKEYFTETIERKFNEPGIYSVELTISDGSQSKTVKLDSVIFIKPELKAKFSYSALNPSTFKYTNESTGDISTLEWIFSDGYTSKSANPTHEFPNNTYASTTLIVKDSILSDTTYVENIFKIPAFELSDIYFSDIYSDSIPYKRDNAQIYDAVDVNNEELLIYMNTYSGFYSDGRLYRFNTKTKEMNSIIDAQSFGKLLKRNDTVFVFIDNMIYRYNNNQLYEYLQISNSPPQTEPKLHNGNFYAVYDDSLLYFEKNIVKRIPIVRKRSKYFVDILPSGKICFISNVDYSGNYNFTTANLDDTFINNNTNDSLQAQMEITRTKLTPYNTILAYSYTNFGNHFYNIELFDTTGGIITRSSNSLHVVNDVIMLNDTYLCATYITDYDNIEPFLISAVTGDLKVSKLLKFPEVPHIIGVNQRKIILMPDSSICILGESSLKKFYYFRSDPLKLKLENDSVPKIDTSKDKINSMPNPSTGTFKLQLKIEHDAYVSIVIFDAFGNKLLNLLHDNLSHGDKEFDFDISSLHPGFYYMQIFIGGKQYVRKIVKI